MDILEQTIISLKPRSRGFHIITSDIVKGLSHLTDCESGILHLQLLHTSASLTINESADPDVRSDLFAFLPGFSCLDMAKPHFHAV